MSRIGRLPVAIPAGVTVEVAENNVVTVTGPKGTLTKELPTEMEIKVEGEEVTVTRPNDLKNDQQHGCWCYTGIRESPGSKRCRLQSSQIRK